MTVYEMEGFLCGKCLPGDMKVNESNAQYLVRKLSELQSQNADMAVQLANAESKCSELATELSAVDKIHNEAVFITDDHYEQCPPEVQRMIRSLAVLRIPAYDAFLAEVRAQGVEELASLAGNECKRYKSVNYRAGVRKWKSIVILCSDFAAQLRKGGAL
ncbi:TPA: hypothetical protein ACPSK6_005075 [Citrobacter freundii]